LLLDSLHNWSVSGGGADAVDTLAALRSEAFDVAQRAGASRTSGAFAHGAAQAAAKRRGVGDLAKRWDDVQVQLAALEVAFSTAAGSGGPEVAQVIANLNIESRRLRAEFTKTEAALEIKAPDFFNLIKPKTVSVADIQSAASENAKILRPDEAVILLIPGEASTDKAFQRDSLILAVSKTKIGWAALPETVDIFGEPQPLSKVMASLQAAARSGIGMKPGETSLVPFDLDIAHALYKALFASSDEIKGVLNDPAIKTWVLAPQGAFLSLPYAALVMEDPKGSDSRDPQVMRTTKWLGIERTLTIIPSVSSLAIQRLKLNPKSAVVAAQGDNIEFLGFGDPDFARTNESRDNCPPVGEGGRSDTPGLNGFFQGVNTNPKSVRELKRLPGTCREIKTLAQTFKAPSGNVVLGLGASEAGVRNHPRLSQARILAFATHGLIKGSLQNSLAQPALAFTPPPPPTTPDQLLPENDDGLLTTTDAATLDLQADWVLLSACDTAAKDGQDPDGLSGLARAFFYAGARSLLVSHWPVHDEAGMRLTTKAVELQRKDPTLTRPQAFRLSMQALMQDTNNPRFAHPAFWAPFFVVSPE
jgi:CHAT domain-containing protein